MIAALLAAAWTFTATATGLEKGSPVEFVFLGNGSDRTYEGLFELDGDVGGFAAALEKAGLPRGRPTDISKCRLWPVGCTLSFKPALTEFMAGRHPDGLSFRPVYTGGTRLGDGSCEAATNMPLSAFSTYSIAQSPIVPDGIWEQGMVYGSFTSAKTLKKGEKVTFTVSWETNSAPRAVSLVAKPGNAVELLKTLRDESGKGDVDALVDFDGALTIAEATAVAQALATLDSPRVRLNGYGSFFYRAFLPLVKWLDRRERLTQPFEIMVGADGDKLIFVDEDWSVDGDDPKLTPREIPFAEASKHLRTDTCFIFANKTNTVARVLEARQKLKGTRVKNWYVFGQE